MDYEKMRKTSIFGYFGPKWQILDSFWLKCAKRELLQKSAWNIFLTNCKVSEKSNERFSSNRVTDGRTHAQTNGRESLGLQ